MSPRLTAAEVVRCRQLVAANTSKQVRSPTVDAPDGSVVDGAEGGVLNSEVGAVLSVHAYQGIIDGLQCSLGRPICLNVHVQIKAVVLASEERLLILVLSHVLHQQVAFSSELLCRQCHQQLARQFHACIYCAGDIIGQTLRWK